MTERRQEQIVRDDTATARAEESTLRQQKVIELSLSHVEQLDALTRDFEVLQESMHINTRMTQDVAISLGIVKTKIEGIDVAALQEATQVLTKLSGSVTVLKWIGGLLQWLGKVVVAVGLIYAAIRYGFPKQ